VTLYYASVNNALSPRRLVDAEGGGWTAPFWSPDGKWIGLFDDRKLKKVQISGGPPVTLCAAPNPTGATWSQNDVILFTPDIFHPDRAGIFRVAAAGGEPVPLTRVDPGRRETAHVYPYFLPDGQHFLYLTGIGSGNEASRSVFVGALNSQQPVRLIASDSNAIYVRDHLLFLRNRTLLAQPFDIRHFQIHGEPVPIAQDIEYFEPLGQGFFSASNTGVLAYTSDTGALRRLVWFDRGGKEIRTIGTPSDYWDVELSPDQTRLALERVGPADQERIGVDDRPGAWLNLAHYLQSVLGV
jgi:eukaryotic-like serine/threonine-protein kinase